MKHILKFTESNYLQDIEKFDKNLIELHGLIDSGLLMEIVDEFDAKVKYESNSHYMFINIKSTDNEFTLKKSASTSNEIIENIDNIKNWLQLVNKVEKKIRNIGFDDINIALNHNEITIRIKIN